MNRDDAVYNGGISVSVGGVFVFALGILAENAQIAGFPVTVGNDELAACESECVFIGGTVGRDGLVEGVEELELVFESPLVLVYRLIKVRNMVAVEHLLVEDCRESHTYG